ncbi:MAG: hypothetical protein FJY07_04710 [Bacteroidetes bacterium]|nr:hypothetical protein [Bacteroidota bacterium]
MRFKQRIQRIIYKYNHYGNQTTSHAGAHSRAGRLAGAEGRFAGEECGAGYDERDESYGF